MARNRGAEVGAAPSTGSAPVPQYPIESVDNALRLLLLFAEKPRIRLTDASNYLGVASSTAHRLLAMLQYRGFVRQDATSKAYVPGAALSTIAAAVSRHVDSRARARPVLEQLNAELGETVHLGRLEGNLVQFLDSVESTRAVRVVSRVGRLMPAHCTSSGKAMLSQLSAEQLRVLYPNEELDGLTEHSVGTRTQLVHDLQAVRRRGYALSDEESEDGVTSVSVPIDGTSGQWYALNVSVPVNRMNPTVRKAIAAALQYAAEELTAQLD